MTTPALFIATPVYDRMTETARESFERLQYALMKAKRPFVHFTVPGCSFVGWARDLAAHEFMKCDGTGARPRCDRFVFFDADIGYEAKTVLQMLDIEEPVLAVACPKKELNEENLRAGILGRLNLPLVELAADFVFNPLVDRELQVDERGLLKVKSAGTGFLMIQRHVFEQIREVPSDRWFPDGFWYRSGANPQTLGEMIFAFFVFRIRKDEEDGLLHYDSEDYSFCLRWRALGGRVMLLADADVSHTGSYTFRGNLQKTLAIGGKLPMPKKEKA